ncbi:hypothetical protein [Desulfovibrio sp. JC010]|uniref:hypothetical protein n=1 Tax=Desulfovibrio sp. JC010 TaxID=2593641 RepID=UPI0013D1BD65|nr:hypothetical protein [Desulfovibrio sp. JC010]NDV25958.1 hypothetical protein [Desulfovibrio sp. JC010]
MEGQTIYKAAQIVSRTGGQIEQIFNRIDEFVAELVENSEVFKNSVTHNGGSTDSSGWVNVSDIRGYGFIETGKQKKETFQLAFLVRIMDEDESLGVSNWQPCLYMLAVMNDGYAAWGIDDFYLHSALGKGYRLGSDNKMLVWDEEGERGAVFVVPLTSISDEVVLKEQIVEPVFSMAEKLLDESLMEYELATNLAFKYEIVDSKLVIT